jgi:hypothetical protein
LLHKTYQGNLLDGYFMVNKTLVEGLTRPLLSGHEEGKILPPSSLLFELA